MIDTSGDAAVYHYDPVGNLLGISRVTSTQVSVIELSPDAGPVGQSVTIYGTGFSATAGQNVVSFNGTSASIVSASTTMLVVTVPSGAATGTIAVTSPNGSDTSDTSFTVTAPDAPTITSFSPTIGTAGTPVTITGTGFNTTPLKNNLSFNVAYATVGTATTTEVSTTLPAAGTSGRISVATPTGVAVSSQDFFVPPSPYGVADVLVADRLAFATARVVSMSTANKIGLLLFDLGASQRASLKVSSVTIGLSSISIRDPYGRTAATLTSGAGGGFIDPVTAVVPGTYTVLVDPSSSYTGNATLTAYDVPPDLTGTIAADGVGVTVAATVPGQNVRRTFSGVAGQRVSLRTTGSLYTATVSVLDPNGVSLGSIDSGFFMDTATLPVAGQYTVLVDHEQANLNPVTLYLYDVPPDATGSLSVGGPSVPVNITTPGQNGLLTFTGTVGQRISVTLNGGTLPTGSATVRDDGGTVVASGIFCCGAQIIEPFILPATATYSIALDIDSWHTGTVTVTVNDVPPDVTGSITPGGSPVSVTLSGVGQVARLTFTGSAGQRVSLSVAPGAPSGLDPIWWTLSEGRIRCPRCLPTLRSDAHVASSLTSSKSKPFA